MLQGIDAAGKDGICWHVIRAMNPQGTTVTGFKQPTPEELAHDFLWRVHPHAPRLGQVAVFNRSHYEDVLVVRVHKLVPKSVWSKRYDQINDFESLLADRGVTILKFFLWISPEEQLERFRQRLDDPARQWKISGQRLYRARATGTTTSRPTRPCCAKCSTRHAPWFVIPSNHKWFRNLAVSEIIADTLDGPGHEDCRRRRSISTRSAGRVPRGLCRSGGKPRNARKARRHAGMTRRGAGRAGWIVTILVFLLVYLAMGFGHLPGFKVDRTGAAVVGALVADRRWAGSRPMRPGPRSTTAPSGCCSG